MMRTLRRSLAVLCLVGVLYGLWVLSTPRWVALGLEALAAPGTEALPIAQIVAFPQIVSLLFLLGFVVAGVLLAWRRRRRKGTERSATTRSNLGPAVCVLGLIASVACLVLALVPTPSHRTNMERDHEMSIVSWNVHDELSEDNLRDITDARPEVVVLPEASTGKLRDHLRELGRQDLYQVFATRTDPQFTPTSVLVSTKLGHYRTTDGGTTTPGTLTLEPSDPSSAAPTILAVHTASPVPRAMNLWAREIGSVLDGVCPRTGGKTPRRPTVAAGDFNATPWHGEMVSIPNRPGCQDALPNSGVSAGTWPSNSPAWARTQIDHVIGNGSVTVEDGRILPLPGTSDHRPIGARIRY